MPESTPDVREYDPALAEASRTGDADDEISIIARVSDVAALPAGVRVVTRFGDVVTLRARRSHIAELAANPAVLAMEATYPLRPTLAEVEADTEAADAEAEDAGDPGEPPDRERAYVRRPPGLTATGRGVVVAVLDWGCDFAHPAFRREDGSTRLLALWDQRATPAGGAGNRWGYGRILTAPEIDRALGGPRPYETLDYDPADADPPEAGNSEGSGSHGTHVLDIAAGNGRGGGEVGVAPEADLVFVHLAGTADVLGRTNLGDSVTVLEALDFVFQAAGDRPCVVNMSVGAHGGPHDGTTLVEQGIDRAVWLFRGRVVVNSAGNYYRSRAHAQGRLAAGTEELLRFAVPANDPTPNEIEVWYSGADRFEAGVIGPDGVELASVRPGTDAALTIDGHEVGHVYHVRQAENHEHLVDLFLRPRAPGGTWALRLRGEVVDDGRYHAWIERDRGPSPRFARAVAARTCTTGTLCNGHFSIAVGAYDPHHARRSLGPFSSAGPTRDGRVKPEIVAPGVRIEAARSTPPGSAPEARYTVKSGTSMATPHVAGMVAVMCEAAGQPLDIADVRALLLTTAERADDGTIDDLHRFGNGYMDMVAAERAATDWGAAHGTPQPAEQSGVSVVEPVAEPAEEPALVAAVEGLVEQEASVTDDMMWAPQTWTPPTWTPPPFDVPALPPPPTCADSLLQAASVLGAVQSADEFLLLALSSLGVGPQDELQPIACPSAALSQPVQRGDVMVRSVASFGRVHSAVVLSPADTAESLRARGVPVESAGAGTYVEVIEVPFGGGAPRVVGRRLTDSWGRVPRGEAILRPAAAARAAEAAVPESGEQEAEPVAWPEDVDDADAGVSEHQPGLSQRREDPRYLFDPNKREASPVWAESQRLREVVEAVAKGVVPDKAMRSLLRDALERQLPTLLLWNQVSRQRLARRDPGIEPATATLYVISFPGESADGTGIKQLNDKVLGYDRNTQFIRDRQDIIDHIFDGAPGGSGFITVGQDYKTASIVAAGKTRREFAEKLVALDGKLKDALVKALNGAEEDARKDTDEARKKARLKEIAAVRKAIGRRKWRFDFLFGAATRPVTMNTEIETVFLLLTEALKAAGVARFIAKAQGAGGGSGATADVARRRAQPDDKKDDDRGKLFDETEFLRTLEATAAVRDAMSVEVSTSGGFLVDYMNIYVDGVWTVPWVMYHPDEQRPIANPDVLRDARKRLLADPPFRAGTKYSFKAQVRLLELWLTAVNTIDLIKDFVVPEFKNELVWYHRSVDDAHEELEGTGRVDGARLVKVLTRDLRQGPDPLPVLGRASEFQFYAHSSDHADRIFFVMDVRDLGVDLLIPYELSADEILWRRLAGRRLMAETFWSSDPVNRRKRVTYEAVVDEFRKAHGRVTRDPGWKDHVVAAFGAGAAVAPMPAFAESLEVMMGGDEVFVAAHPAYAGQAREIIAALDQRRHAGLPLNLRAAVAYSSAIRPPKSGAAVPPSPDQRRRNAEAHDEALALASSAPNALKEFERTHRRIERLIEKVPRDPRRERKADPKRDKEREEKAKKYRQELEALGLMKLYASLKHGRPGPMDPGRLRRLVDALAAGDAEKATAAADEDFDLVDFQGRVVDVAKLRQAARALEGRVEPDAKRNNVHFDPPPLLTEKPALPKWLRELLSDRAYKLVKEWYDDDGRKEWEWNRDPKPDPASKVA